MSKITHKTVTATEVSPTGLVTWTEETLTTDKPDIELDGSGKKAMGLTRWAFALDSAAYTGDTDSSNPKTDKVSTSVNVSSDVQTAKGGTRRIMVKFDLPYQALSPDASESALAQGFSPSRSGKMISLHAVLTVPKEVVQDMRGANGTAVANVAAAQIEYLRALLASVLMPKAILLSEESVDRADPIKDAARVGVTARQDDPLNRGIAGYTPLTADSVISLRMANVHMAIPV